METKKFNKLNKKFIELYKLSFPKDEKLPYSLLKKILKSNEGELIHYYDENKFVGFILSISFEKFTCLAFFATDPQYRNQGYGKTILNMYSKENENQIIFLNCEAPEDNNPENIKYRRLSFYKRNGYLLIPLVMTFKNIDYLTLVNKPLNEKEIHELNKMLTRAKCSCTIDNTVCTKYN